MINTTNIGEDKFNVSFPVDFYLGEEVYLKTDADQAMAMVIGYEVYDSGILYVLSRGAWKYSASSIELSRTKNVINY